MNKNRGVLFVLVGAASFGFTPVFVKTAFANGYSLGQLNIAQMAIAFLFLWGIAIVRRSSFKGINRVSIVRLLVTGAFVGLTSVFYYASIQYLPASLAIILLFQFVWIGMVFEWVFTNIKPTILTLGAIALILTGVFFASDFVGGTIQDVPVIGVVLGLLAAFSYAGFIFFSGKAATTVDPWVRSATMVTGSLILVTILFMGDIPDVPAGGPELWLLAAGVGLFGAVLPPLFFAMGAHQVPDGLANILSSVELPVAIISASLILSEEITVLQWAGILLIIGAIVMNELGSMKLKYRMK
ncbi:DMT family transporter [Virgibacillus xinjiangensis]|uniref:DMT family transporter n=1 Tax=Virgibacillus xinjiangensis TaxID=393090 RepID=A0ABV7CYA3_9BACI